MGSSSRRAFTLIELLTVIAIIAILAGILFPVFAKAREKAESTDCLSNLNQIGKSLLMYADDFDQKLPMYAYRDSGGNVLDAASGGRYWPAILFPYTKNNQIMTCKAFPVDQNYDGNATPQRDGDGVSYGMNWRLDSQKITRVAFPAQTALVFDMSEGNNPWTAIDSTAGNISGVQQALRANHSGDEVQAGIDTGQCITSFVDGHSKPVTIQQLTQVESGSPGTNNIFNPRRSVSVW